MTIRLGYGEYYPVPSSLNNATTAQWHARLLCIEAIDEIGGLKDIAIADIYPLFTLLIIDIANLAAGEKPDLIPEGWSVKDAFETIRSYESMINYLGESAPCFRELTQDERNEVLNPNSRCNLDYIMAHSENAWSFRLAHFVVELQALANLYHFDKEDWFFSMIVVLFWRKAYKSEESWTIPVKDMMEAMVLEPQVDISKSDQTKTEKARKTISEAKEITISGWSFLTESRAEAEKRINMEIQQHLDRIDKSCQDIGLVKTPGKRNMEHFKWFAYHHVMGWSYEEIAQFFTDSDPKGKQSIGTDSVKKAIKNTISLLGLKLQEIEK